MNEFDYNIIHIKGKSSVIADNLSRCLIISQNKKDKFFNLIKSASIGKNINDKKKDKYGRIIINRTKIKWLLNSLHNMSGHRGISTMYNNLKDHLHIDNMIKHIKDVVKR